MNNNNAAGVGIRLRLLIAKVWWMVGWRVLLRNLLGSYHAQGFWENMQKASLGGLCYGMDDYAVETSGETAVISVLPKQGPVLIFDVGANVGEYARLLAATLGTRAKVHAFEPGGDTYSRLKRNCAESRNIVPHHLGLSCRVGEMTMHRPGADGGRLNSLYRRDYFTSTQVDLVSETCRFDTVDEFCRRQNIHHIDLLKIDVEGHEVDVLRGAERMLSDRSIAAIQWEFGGCAVDSRIFFRDFVGTLGADFILYRIVRDGLYPLPAYSEFQEVFRGANFLAVQRPLYAMGAQQIA